MTWCYGDAGRARHRLVFGAFLVLAGVLALLNNLGIIFIPSLWRLFWPAVLILVGINMLRRHSRVGVGGWETRNDFAPSSDSNSTINLSAVLGSAQHKSPVKNFSGADLNAFLGGVNLDLRDATMEGNTATVDLFVMMGGMEIFIPTDWTVDNQVTPILGGFEDKSSRPKDPNKRLIVHGTVVMGGCEIKN
jgi:predicted membrane protein